MRIILLGTGPFAVPSFRAIAATGAHELPLVVTRPIKHDGNETRKSIANPVRAWAESQRLPIVNPPSINDSASIEMVSALKPDLLVVCDYGEILSSETLAAAHLGGINLHGSLLPRHRGAAPVQWSILRGDKLTGACVIHMTPKLDGGPILSRVTAEIYPHETAGELEHRLSVLGVECCVEAIAKLAKCASIDESIGLGDRQDNTFATSAPRLAKSDGQLDFRYPAALIDRQIRGLQPWPGTFGTLEIGESKEWRVSIGKARLLGVAMAGDMAGLPTISNGSKPPTIRPGSLIWGETLRNKLENADRESTREKNRSPQLAVACADELLEIEQLQPAGKRMLEAREFLAGYGKSDSLRFRMEPNALPHRLLEKCR